MSLIGKTALITGAGRGLGQSVAVALAREGARVVCTARTWPEIEKVAETICASGGHARALQADITDPNQVQHLFRAVEEAFGGLDILVNNAGLGIFGPAGELAPEQLEAMLAVNLKGTVYCCQEALPLMEARGSGDIVNVISTSARTGRPEEAGYAASKWAAAGFTECLKQECKPRGIRVMGFYPGGINTPFWNEPSAHTHQPSSGTFMPPAMVAEVIIQMLGLPRSMVMDEVVVRRT